MIDYPEGMPCWAPGAADYLASILTGDEIGWEWGGGASSVWLSPRVKHLHVMEHDEQWADKIMDDSGFNLTMHEFSFLDPHYIDRVELIDPRPNLWLIDGYCRIDCLELVERKVLHGDIVVLDDALDYGEHLMRLDVDEEIHHFAMPHPHAGKPCVSAKNTRERNTVRITAPATKETWIWQV